MPGDCYISVDVETAGPIPALYALLSIGACLVDDPQQSFYVELQPDRDRYLPEALAISGLSLEILQERGLPPIKALHLFEEWVHQVVPQASRPVFVALNAPFDWMFISDYFHRYLGFNPFGHNALDIKAYYMGKMGVSWSETSYRYIASFLHEQACLSHNALNDACDQAALFRKIRQLA